MNHTSKLSKEVFLPELQPYIMLSENTYDPENISEEGIERTRKIFTSGLPTAADICITEKTVTGIDGNTIPIRVFSPESTDNVMPALLYIHGGGYIVGADAQCYEQIFAYCRAVPCIAVMPEFRLAPENPYPAGIEDCYCVLEDMWQNPADYGIDRDRIAVTGFSCGGAMTIALCLMARDRGGPHIRFQMPVAPTMDDRLNTSSALNITDMRILNLHFLRKIWNYYLGEGHENRDIDAYAAPSRSSDYSNLPPCFLHIAEYDPHYDEAITYVRRLKECGVPVAWKEYRGCFHAFEISAAKTKTGKEANMLLAEKLKEGLA